MGEWLTRMSVWLSLVGYAAGEGMLAVGRRRRGWLDGARWAWTLGCGLMVAHVGLAFGWFHDWSHAAAHADTARQTADLTGIRWGGGIYLNYVFVAAWIADVVWWWVAPSGFACRSWWLTSVWRGFAFFMVFNGAVVFASGPGRWLGVLICGSLVVLWVRKWHGETALLRG